MKLRLKKIFKISTLFVVCTASFSEVSAQQVLKVDSLIWPNRSGFENLLQGNVAGLDVKNWSGTPGTQSVLNLRGLSIYPTDESSMPLVMVNGVPVISRPSEYTGINPLSYYSPNQIDRIEILKDIDQLAALGVQAPNGAINIITKNGQTGPLRVSVSTFAGGNYLSDMDHQKDAFYGFNTIARRNVYGRSTTHDENLIVDGGGNYGSYLFGLGNHYDGGVVNDTHTEQQSLLFNANYNITNAFTAQIFNNLALASRDGRYAGEYDRSLDLPVVADEKFFMDKKRNVGLLSSIHLKYNFSPGFYIHSRMGLSYESARRDLYIPSTILDDAKYSLSVSHKRQLLSVNTTLNYAHKLGDALKLHMVLGNDLNSTDNRLTYVNGSSSMESGGSNYIKVVTGYTASESSAMSDHEDENLLSFHGTWNLKYKDNLTLNLVLRADGSSLYAHKWALYPALGASYSLKEFAGIPVTLKAAYGKTGVLNRLDTYRGQLSAYGYYYSGTELGIGELYSPFKGAKSVDVYQFDAGFVYQFNRSLRFTANYFNKRYKGFTYERYLPNISGLDYEYETGAELGLSGIELSLSGAIVDQKKFGWSCEFNFAANKNEVVRMPDDIGNTSLSEFSTLGKGDAITSFIAYEGDNQKVVGNSKPDFWGGFGNTFRYGRISAGFMLTYSQGSDIVAESMDSRYSEDQVEGGFPLKSAETPYYFKQADDAGNTVYQGIRSIENGSFIRLSKAMISYDLSSLFEGNMLVSGMDLYVRADNLFTLSKYAGVNPEENIAGVRKYDLSYTGTPLPASVVLGLKLKF
jgi:TonB-dependent starch-binding outer membrane protein SusC